MPWHKVNAIYLTDEERGAVTVFAFSSHQNWGHPDISALQQNTWHRPACPGVPADARFVNLCGMYVGGDASGDVGGRGFMVHVDFRNPHLPEIPAADWSNVSGQGDHYQYFYNENHRESVGGFWVPCKDGRIMLRWKADGDGQNPFGINFYVQAYAT